MSDPASQANELRLLEQKRLRGGLSPEEEARRGVLAAGAPAPRGFDVHAAAAHVRALREAEAPHCPEPAASELPAPAFVAPPVAATPPVVPAALPVIVPAAPPADDLLDDAPPQQDAGSSLEAAPSPDTDLPGGGPDDPVASTADPLRGPGGTEAAPVYDAAAYGLDPSDPDAVAWAAWYAAQGWDPATAYAYAQQMNAGGDPGACAPAAEPHACETDAAEGDPPAAADPDPATAPALDEAGVPPAEPSDDAIPELPAEAILEATAGGFEEPAAAARQQPLAEPIDEPGLDASGGLPELGAEGSGESSARSPRAAEGGSDSIPELPPLELEALDATADAQAAGELPQADVAIDLGPEFGADAPRTGGPPEDGAPTMEGLHAALAPDVGWAERAVPARDEPVDFAAFDAEPAPLAAPGLFARDAQRTAMWELGDALPGTGIAREETPPEIGAGADELPMADLASGPSLGVEEAPESGASSTPEAAAEPGGLADSLELPPPEPMELKDEDILEVGEDVVEIAEAPPALAAEPATMGVLTLPEEFPVLAPASSDLVTASSDAVETGDDSSPAPPERTLALGGIAPDAPPAAETEPPPLGTDWSAPEPEPSASPFGTPGDEEQASGTEPEREPPPAADAFVAGTHRVVLHTSDGQVRRGTVTDVDLDASEVLLTPQGSAAAQGVPVEQIKAIFFMLPLGQPPADPEGRRVRVTFRDGRQVAGFSADYAPERPGFFVVPADTRTHTARIWVYRSAVRQVSVT